MEGVGQLQVNPIIIRSSGIGWWPVIEVIIRGKTDLEVIGEYTDFGIQVDNNPVPARSSAIPESS